MSLDDNKNSIDIDFLRKIIGDDLSFEKELFEIFLDNSKYNISKLDKALKDEDNNACAACRCEPRAWAGRR